MRHVFLLVFLIFSFFAQALDHSGVINEEEYWDNSFTHFITDDVTIYSTVTIEAGTVIRIYENKNLKIRGTLIANGTSENEITFTSRAGGDYSGFWKNICFENAGEGNILNYCNIAYGGSVDGMVCIVNSSNNVQITNSNLTQNGACGIYISESSPIISNVLVSGSSLDGIYSTYTNSIPTISNCQISNNGGNGIYTSSGSDPLIQSCSIQNNDGYAIRIYAANVKNITGNMVINGNNPDAIAVRGESGCSGTWLNHGVPYIIQDANMSVTDSATLTLEAGTQLKFDGDYSIQVQGKLIAEGTSEDRINFTSNQNPPAPGDWKNIFFSNADNGCSLEYCDFLYGGSDNDYGCLYLDESDVNFNNCKVEFSGDHGVYIFSNSNPSFINCVIRNNNDYGIKLAANTNHPVFGCNLSEWNDIYNNNGGSAGRNFRNANSSNSAEYVYWGTLDQTEIDNTIYDDNEGTTYLDFTPWTNSVHDLEYPITVLLPPENVEVTNVQGTVSISWNTVSGATSYQVFSADSPEESTKDWILIDEVSNPSWTGYSSETKKFYFVKAVNQTNKLVVK